MILGTCHHHRMIIRFTASILDLDLSGHHDFDPAPLRDHKGLTCIYIAMFGIISEVLMSTLTVDD